MYNQILAQGNWIGFSKPLARGLQSIEASLLLSEILNQLNYFNEEEVFITYEHFAEQIILTPHKARKAVNILIDNKLIEVNRKGVPAKNYYKLHKEFKSSIERILSLDVKKFNNRKSKNLTTINNTKEIILDNNIPENSNNFNNFNKFDNEQENEYIDFRPLAKEGKIGLLGKAKAICQDKLSYLTFDDFDNKKLSDILGSIKANLNAYNKQNNITARVTDESVLKAFKTALNSILNKSEETPSLAYVKSCLTPSLYLNNQSKETGKATSKPAGKDSGNNYSEYLKIVQAKFPHYQRLTPLDIKHLEQILSDIKGNGGTDIENFKELFENLPAWVLRSRVYQSVGFVASKINELNISLDEQIRSTEGFDFLVKKRGEAAAYELVKKVILKKKNASNS